MIAVGLDGEATVVDYPDTAFGPQIDAQAWSAGELPTEPLPYREHHSWVRAVAVAVGTVVAAAAVVLALTGSDSSDSPPATDPSTATPSAEPADTPIVMPPPFTMPPDVEVAHQTKDGDYLQRLIRVNHVITNRAEAISWAHDACHNLADGFTPMEIAVAQRGYDGLPVSFTLELVQVARDVYCPEIG